MMPSAASSGAYCLVSIFTDNFEAVLCMKYIKPVIICGFYCNRIEDITIFCLCCSMSS